jgi:hypothetical protein
MQVTAEPGKTVAFYLMMLATVSVGVYLRLDQFGLQVLLDDEWHVTQISVSRWPCSTGRS